MKTLNLRIDDETHRRLRILAAHLDQTHGELLTAWVNQAWIATRIEEPEGKAKPRRGAKS